MIKTFIAVRKHLPCDVLAELVVLYITPKYIEFLYLGLSEMLDLLGDKNEHISFNLHYSRYVECKENRDEALAEQINDIFAKKTPGYISLKNHYIYLTNKNLEWLLSSFSCEILEVKRYIHMYHEDIDYDRALSVAGDNLYRLIMIQQDQIYAEKMIYIGYLFEWCRDQKDAEWVRYTCSALFQS